MSNFPALFGGVIAYILLALYATTVRYMTYMVAQYEQRDFTAGVTYVVTTVGGLVSALVVARLAVAVPGRKPTLVPSAAHERGDPPGTLSDVLTAAYLIVWLLTGLAALVVGVMLYSGVNTALAGIGTTWLGLAVAAGYAYFGLEPGRGGRAQIVARQEEKQVIEPTADEPGRTIVVREELKITGPAADEPAKPREG